VTGSVRTIAAMSEEQSAATEAVSASAEEMSAQIDEMSAQAQELAATAEQLKGLWLRSASHGPTRLAISRCVRCGEPPEPISTDKFERGALPRPPSRRRPSKTRFDNETRQRARFLGVSCCNATVCLRCAADHGQLVTSEVTIYFHVVQGLRQESRG